MVASESEKRIISLPTIKRVHLEQFDLYSNTPTIEIPVEKPVFCLIGANGLGKSTFLNTVNFTITGAIPDPDRKFQSAPDYLRKAARPDRAEDYFSGRISEKARSLVRATVELAWPDATICVTRELFNNSTISRLTRENKTSGEIFRADSTDEDGENLSTLYENFVVELSKLEDFSQFVFLMHFVATFDEGRHLLLWDDDALTNALYLAFGADPVAAKAADKLQQDMERESSRGRNVRFSARHVEERIKQLEELLKGDETDDYTTVATLKAQHAALVHQHEQAEERLRRKQAELRNVDLKWTDLSSALTETQIEYRKVFASRLQKSSSVEHHPIIRASLSEGRCAICGTVHGDQQVRKKLEANECPLCISPLERTAPNGETIAALQKLDKEIIRIRDELGLILRTRDRIGDEFAAAQASEEAAATALKAFENKEARGLLKASKDSSFSGIRKEIEKMEAERREFLSQSEAHYKKRDEIREHLRVYERALKAQYEIGSEQFVPRFRELAQEFIGLPIDVELEHRQGKNDSGFGLRLHMDDQLRSQHEAVSESQRFFLDIALRMALSEFMSSDPATLLIDTPEGSLDIAYEARAGAMFSKFVSMGNNVIMTANLRSSELLLRLAKIQKHEGMQIVRMTDWTDLSEVQQSEEALFLRAYNQIETALGS